MSNPTPPNPNNAPPACDEQVPTYTPPPFDEIGAKIEVPIRLRTDAKFDHGISYLPWSRTDQKGTSKQHNRGHRPGGFVANLICKVAHNGWAVGDVISLPHSSTPHEDDFGVVIYNWNHLTYDWFVHGSSETGRTGKGPHLPSLNNTDVDPAHSNKWDYQIVAIG